MYQKKFRVWFLLCAAILFRAGCGWAYTVANFRVVYIGPDSIHAVWRITDAESDTNAITFDVYGPSPKTIEVLKSKPPRERWDYWNELSNIASNLSPGYYIYSDDQGRFLWSGYVGTNVVGTPLVPQTIEGASNLMLNVYGGNSNSLFTIRDSSFSGTIEWGEITNCTVFASTNWPINGAIFKNCRVSNSRMSGSTVFSLAYNNMGNTSLVENCLFEAPIQSTYGVVFTNCEFYGDVGGDLGINDAIFKDCCFLGVLNRRELYLPPDQWLIGNSFLGRQAMDLFKYGALAGVTNVNVSSNFFGVPPSPGMFNPGFLQPNGSTIACTLPVDATNALSKGKPRTYKREMFPDIWCTGGVIGQHIIQHFYDAGGFSVGFMRQGRPSLVSVDVRSWDEEVSGVEVYAELDGVRCGSSSAGKVGRLAVLHRERVAAGRTTFNFQLPPVMKETAELTLYLDTTGVTAYTGTNWVGRQLIYSNTLNFAPAPARCLRLRIEPWQNAYFSKTVPKTDSVDKAIKNLMPGILPLKADEISYMTGGAQNYNGYLHPLTYLSNNGMLVSWMSDVYARLLAFNALSSGSPIDALIAVIPFGALGSTTNTTGEVVSAQGATFRMFPGVIMIEEGNGEAVVHELGHRMGLYVSPEQYDMPGGSLRLVGMTGWSPDPRVSVNRNSSGYHFLAANGTSYYDVMGNVNPFWIHPSTLGQMGMGLYDILGYQTSPGGMAAMSDGISLSEASGKHLLFSITSRNGIIQSVQALDATEVPSDFYSKATKTYSSYYAGPAYYNRLMAYDSQGNLLATLVIRSVPETLCGIGAQSDLDPAVQDVLLKNTTGVVIPPDTARLELRGNSEGPYANHIFWQCETTVANNRTMEQTSEAGIISPVPGQALGGSARIAWVNSLGSSQALHQIYYSTDEATWTPWGAPGSATDIMMDTSDLPASSNITLKVVSSDGLNTHFYTVSGLSVDPRIPTAQILEPASGLRSTEGTSWTLRAVAANYDGGALSCAWSSSLDGLLGTNEVCENVTLSPGTHTLNFMVTNSTGQTAMDTVSVTVTNFSGVDFAVPENALSLNQNQVQGGESSPVLISAATNLLLLALNNEGTVSNVEADVLIYIRDPAGETSMAISNHVEFLPFGSASIETRLTPALVGIYQVQAVVTNLSIPEEDWSNNSFTWNIPTGSGELMVVLEPEAAVTAGARWAFNGGAWQESGTVLSNLPASGEISIKDVPGFTSPGGTTAMLAPGQRTVLRAAYGADTTSLQVSFGPAGAPLDDARWCVDGGPWLTGATVFPVEEGSHTLSFLWVPGWAGPEDLTVTVVRNEHKVVDAIYTMAALPVIPVAVPDGASGQSIINLALEWVNQAGTSALKIYLGTNSNLTSSNLLATLDAYISRYTLSPLDFDKTYYWRVNAVGFGGRETPGPVWSFTTEAPRPVILSPLATSAEVNSLWEYQLETRSCTGFKWGTLPAWANQSSGGFLSGMPASAELYELPITITNSSQSWSGTISITVVAAPSLPWHETPQRVSKSLYCIAFGNNSFVAGSDDGSVFVSSDGSAWTEYSTGQAGPVKGITFAGGQFIACGGNSGETGFVVTSPDGITWTSASLPLLPGTPRSVCFGRNVAVVVGDNGLILCSTNSQNWMLASLGNYSNLPALSSITCGDAGFIGVGNLSMTTPVMISSPDGINWSGFENYTPNLQMHNAIQGTDGKYVATGNSCVSMTTNGVTWTAGALNGVWASLSAVTFGENLFVAAGMPGCLLVSKDGLTWVNQQVICAPLTGIAFGNGRFIATSYFGTFLTVEYLPDSDRDGLSDGLEKKLGTDPLDAKSIFRIFNPADTPRPASGIKIKWPSAAGRIYAIDRSTNLMRGFISLQPHVVGSAGTTTFTDTSATNAGSYYYKIQTQLE